jgi:hypothetical protein
MPNETTTVLIRSSVFDRDRQLVFSDEGISFEKSDLKGAPLKLIDKKSIHGFRHGMKWVRGLAFVIGRVYCIDILADNKTALKIRLKTMYGVRKTQLEEKYALIIKLLFKYFFVSHLEQYALKIDNGESISLLGTSISQEGIYLTPGSPFITWENLGTGAYTTYYALFSKTDSGNYKAFDYLTDWNTSLLLSLTRTILHRKGLIQL